MKKVYRILFSWQAYLLLTAMFLGLTVGAIQRGEGFLAFATGAITLYYILEAIKVKQDRDEETFVTITYTRSDTLENNK